MSDWMPLDELKCSIPYGEHQWVLESDEGRPGPHAAACCETCSVAFWGLGDAEELMVVAPIPVTVTWATDCPAYPTDARGVPTGPKRPYRYTAGSHAGEHGVHCDCNHWPIIEVKK